MTLDELITQVRTATPTGPPWTTSPRRPRSPTTSASSPTTWSATSSTRPVASGASWTLIGQSMGVTKQAVQKRFVAGDSAMDRFTNRAQVVVLKAQNEGRDRGHREVTSLHLVFGLLAEWEGSPAARSRRPA